MTRIHLKNLPKIKLTDLLRRRKMTLKQLLDEHGITTYQGLVIRCASMGVAPPEERDFTSLVPVPRASNPQEGIVVLKAFEDADDVMIEPAQKKQRRKKDSLDT